LSSVRFTRDDKLILTSRPWFDIWSLVGDDVFDVLLLAVLDVCVGTSRDDIDVDVDVDDGIEPIHAHDVTGKRRTNTAIASDESD
jgi:hypothetical protein